MTYNNWRYGKVTVFFMNKTILVVDDDLDILESLQTILEFADYRVITTQKGSMVERISEEHNVDLILLDMLLSGSDGRDVVKSLKAHEDKVSSIPVIMLSAHPYAEKMARESGADDFVAKPFDMDVLLGRVERWVR